MPMTYNGATCSTTLKTLLKTYVVINKPVMAIQRKRISQCIRSINSVFLRFSVNTYASSLFMPVVIDVTCNFLINVQN